MTCTLPLISVRVRPAGTFDPSASWAESPLTSKRDSKRAYRFFIKERLRFFQNLNKSAKVMIRNCTKNRYFYLLMELIDKGQFD